MDKEDLVLVKILRFNPETKENPGFQQYEVPRGDKIRVLDFLNYIFEELDPTLSFRRHLCNVRLCDGCLMKVNHKHCLICWEKVEKDTKELVIEPMSGYRVMKDLVVDFDKKGEGDAPAVKETMEELIE